MIQRLFILLILLCTQVYNVKSAEALHSAPAFLTDDNTFFLHTVERGQTVYSIARMYKVSEESIYQLNPGSREGIRAESVLKIPQESGSYFFHTIEPKETLYSVSKKYGMKGEDILQVNPGLSVETFHIGKTIRIPTNRVTTPMEGNETHIQRITNQLLTMPDQVEKLNTIRVALLLPFGLQEGTNAGNAASNRYVEYYEGFLLALHDLKKRGISVDVQTYDIGTNTNQLPSVFQKPALQNAHLIIGGLSDNQIKLIATYAAEKNIPYIIPTNSKCEEVQNNHLIYQVNAPQSYLYSKASLGFIRKFKDYNVILHIPNDGGNKKEFIDVLKADLQKQGVDYYEIIQPELHEMLLPVLSKEKNNVIVPSDDSAEALGMVMASLRPIVETSSEYNVSLFGYPSWQSYVARADLADNFFRMNANFYSSFYANPTSSRVRNFSNLYYRWYTRELVNTFPKFGILGYDTGMYFIQLVQQFGLPFDSQINRLNYHGIQSDFTFERVNNWGGFVNTNVYIVDFNSDYTINNVRVQ